jgi:hypothetical protein
MKLIVEYGDVLETKADGLIVPIDGSIVPKVEHLERILGNVGRQFLRRFPEVDMLEEVDAQTVLPIPLGQATEVGLEGSPFPFLILVSTLYHVGHMDSSAKRALVRSSLAAAFEVAKQVDVKVLATPVLQGGWRLPAQEAFATMLQTMAATEQDLTLVVRCLDNPLLAELQGLAQGLGFTR